MPRIIHSAFLVGCLLLASFAIPASAAKKDSPYVGLLPANHKVEVAASQLTIADFGGKRIALIPSKRYLDQVAWVKKRLTNGKFYGQKLEPDVFVSVQIALDPKQILDALIPVIQKEGTQIDIYDDLRSAVKAGADVFVVVDYTGRQKNNAAAFIPFVGLAADASDFHTEGGFYCLDRSLRQVCSAQAKTKVPVENMALFGGANDFSLKIATAAALGQQSFIEALLADLRTKLEMP